MWDRREAYRYLVDKTDGKRALGKPDIRWEHNITVQCTSKKPAGEPLTELIWLRTENGGGNL
jgi:hypothetical protein